MGTLDVAVERLGDLGDGIASAPEGRIHIPFTAPGDRVRVRPSGKGGADLIDVIAPGPDRIAPVCAHFGRCGGCAVQHLEAGFVAAWKRRRVEDALSRTGIAGVQVAETISVAPGTRRRATLAVKRTGKTLRLGFTERGSHRLVDLQQCPVLRPALVALVPPLRALSMTLLADDETADIALTETGTGVDLLLVRRRALSLQDREALAAFAETHDLARIAWRASTKAAAEAVAMRRQPVMRFGDNAVALPPGIFLQPSREGENILTAQVLHNLEGAVGPFADFFCGAGAFTLPVSQCGRVEAYDTDGESVAALGAAIRANGLDGKVSARRRDLFREPLTSTELKKFDAAVLDPPRAGARAQAEALAQSDVKTIAAVSCSPSSFARDAAILIAGGYKLDRVTPVDQFLWSPHVELTARFRR